MLAGKLAPGQGNQWDLNSVRGCYTTIEAAFSTRRAARANQWPIGSRFDATKHSVAKSTKPDRVVQPSRSCAQSAISQESRGSAGCTRQPRFVVSSYSSAPD